MKLFCVYDKKAKFYSGQIFAEESTVQALRGFDTAVNAERSQLSLFPDDFELHQIGHWEKDTGTIVSDISSLGSARTVLRDAPQPSPVKAVQ